MKKWINNLKLRAKLMVSFSIITFLLIVVGFVGMRNIQEINANEKLLYNQVTKPIKQLGDIRYNSQNIKIAVRDMILANEPNEIDSLEASIKASSARIGANADSMAATLITPEEKSALEEYAVIRKNYQVFRKKAMALAKENRDKEALYTIQVAALPSIKEYDRITGKFLDLKTEYGKKLDKVNDRLEVISNVTMIAAITLGIAFSVILGIFLSQMLARNIGQISQRIQSLSDICIANVASASDKLAKGNLDIVIETGTKPLTISSKDEIGSLARDINTIIFNIQSAASSLEIAVAEIKRTIEESNSMVKAASEGKLDVRSDSASFRGGYKELVEGLNKTLDAVITPVSEGKEVLEKMSHGDLTARMKGNYNGDYSDLKESINRLGISMNEALSEVMLAVQSTASASAEISSSADQMTTGSQEQSRQTAEVAASIEEMTRTIIEGAKNTSLAADNSKAASDSAKNGSKKIQETKEGIQRIVESTNETGSKISSLTLKTDQIGQITQVIDDIADQTNLLALNAAIEAARAGEQGRGFAVVADEVRKLAERTMKATKEIGSTIKAIQTEAKEANSSMESAGKAVSSGMKLTEEVSQVLDEILKRANAVSDVIIQVAASGEEQSTAAELISRNVEGISSVTQESAQGIGQIAGAAEDLNRLTLNLQNMVSRFTLNTGDRQGYSQNQKAA